MDVRVAGVCDLLVGWVMSLGKKIIIELTTIF